jgi:ABC-type branched-subunit amino acid transport system ATPase component
MAAPIIETVDFSKRFGALKALNSVTLRVASGSIGLLGPNGAGRPS